MNECSFLLVVVIVSGFKILREETSMEVLIGRSVIPLLLRSGFTRLFLRHLWEAQIVPCALLKLFHFCGSHTCVPGQSPRRGPGTALR